MIYTSYARIAIIVALVSASVATPVAQDQTSLYLEKRAPQGDIEDDDVSDSQQQGRRPSVALMPPGWIRQSTDQNQVSTSSQEKPLPPRLIRQFTSQQPPHQSQESPLSELDDVSDSQPQDRQPKVDRPFPKWIRQSTLSSKSSSSQAALPISRLTRRPSLQQDSSSQIESPLASNSDSDMQTEQYYFTSNASQGGIEDDEMFSPGSSTGGSHGTYDTLSKGETLKSQFTSSCRGKKCKLPRMTEREFFLRDRDLAFIGTDGELTGTYSRDTTVVPYTYRGYLDTVKEIEANNDKKRKSGEKQTVTVSKKRKTGRERVAAVFRKMRLNRQKKTKKNEKQAKTEDEQVKTSTRRLLSDKQALQKWKADTTKLVNELKKRLLVSKEDLEKAFEGSGSEGSSTGRSQMPRAQATQLYIDSAGRVSPIKKEGSRENPTSDRGYLKLLSTLSGRERTEWGLKTNTMLPQIFPVYRTHYI